MKSLGTHSQVQHVHGHCLLCQHLHCGVGVDSDRAAAHCEAQHGVWLSQGCQGAQPWHSYHAFPEQILKPLLSHFQHSGTRLPLQGKLEQGMVPENLSRTKT